MVKCDGCGEQREWLMLVCGRYLCQQCIDEICTERNDLKKKVAELEREIADLKWNIEADST